MLQNRSATSYGLSEFVLKATTPEVSLNLMAEAFSTRENKTGQHLVIF